MTKIRMVDQSQPQSTVGMTGQRARDLLTGSTFERWDNLSKGSVDLVKLMGYEIIWIHQWSIRPTISEITI